MALPANRSGSKNRPRSAMNTSRRTPASGRRSRSKTPRRSLPSSDSETSIDGEREVRVPDLNERLAYLRPSRELLEYYRKKIADYDVEHDIVMEKLEEYKKTYEEQHQVFFEVRSREEEISELQKALSDMQVYLFQEREHVLRLYAENDRLKIRELEDRKKIQHLLALNDVAGDNEVTYFFKEPPAKATVTQRVPKTFLDEDQPRRGRPTQKPSSQSPDRQARYKRDNETLRLQIQALQAQIEEQAKLSMEHIDTLETDRRIKMEEYEGKRERDEEKMKVLMEKLHKAQDLLYDSTKDFLELRHEGRTNEHKWMSEKDKLLQELDACKQQLNISRDKVLDVDESLSHHTQRKYRDDIKKMQNELKQSEKMTDMYREQIVQLEDELAMIKEEGDVTREIFKDRSDKMTKRLDMMNSRYKELEKRRGLEVEGFRTDIKNLRTKLRDVEKHLYKVTAGMGEQALPGERPDDIDMRVLRNVRQTAGRSREIAGVLKLLKAKVYSIENDLRHL